jgi:uncharacterized FlgJ-related protein
MEYKYPRTPHLPWSEGVTSDDKILKSLNSFIGKKVVVTEKMDGENTNFYSDYIHARSLDSMSHPSQSFVKKIWSNMAYKIPKGYRICGENLYATHSIHYDNLKSYFQVFSIWDENNICLNWDDTIELCNWLGLITVPELAIQTFDEKVFPAIWDSIKNHAEGYVVRLWDSFTYENFSMSVAKFVRKNHVQTDEHWKTQKIVPNGII